MTYTNTDIENAIDYINSILTDVCPDEVGSLAALQLLNNAMGTAADALDGLKTTEESTLQKIIKVAENTAGYVDDTMWIVEFTNGVTLGDDLHWLPEIYTDTDWNDEEAIKSILTNALYGRLDAAADEVFELTGIAEV